MYKHIGKHNEKKVVLLFREVPGEDHMCLVSYSDLLPRIYHDEVMKILESPIGQQAENLSDALYRNFMPDGVNCLEALHRNGFIKKVPTNQVIVTPTTTSSVRLDELNTILNEMSKGEEALKRLAEIDASKGMTNKKRTDDIKEVGAPSNSRATPANPPLQAGENSVLTDQDLAKSRIQQAESMKANAQQLLAEAERLLAEAADLDPTVKVKKANVRATKKKAPVKA